MYTSPKFASVLAQEKVNDTAAEAERATADLARVKRESAQRSNEKDSETAAVSDADVEAAKAETRDLTSRLKLAEEQVGGTWPGLRYVRKPYLESRTDTNFIDAVRATSKQVGRLQDSLKEATANLLDSQRVVTSLRLSSERAVSNMAPKVSPFALLVVIARENLRSLFSSWI